MKHSTKKSGISLGLTIVSSFALILIVFQIGRPIPTGGWVDWLRIALIIVLALGWYVAVKPVSNGVSRWLVGQDSTQQTIE